jgi:hypothetical protein
MSLARDVDRRRVLVGAVLGFLAAALSGAAGSPYAAGVLGPLIAGAVVGLLATSPLDEVSVESFFAGAISTGLLYLGVVGYVVLSTRGSALQGDFVFVAGAFGWLAAVFLLPLFGVLGYLGARVGRPVGRRLRSTRVG